MKTSSEIRLSDLNALGSMPIHVEYRGGCVRLVGSE